MASKLTDVLAIVGFALFIAIGSYFAGRSRGKAEAALVQSQAHADTIKIAVTKAETVFVSKVDTFTVWRTKTIALRDTLLRHVADTVLVKQYVAASDTALRACSDVIISCDTIRVRYASLVKQDSVTQALLRKQQPSLWDKIKQNCGLAGGYSVTTRGGDVSVSCILVHIP